MCASPDSSQHVLVTGAAGAIGMPVCRELIARGHRVRGFDLRPPSPAIDGLTDMRLCDLTDRDAVEDAVAGVDSIIHLGACPDEADFLSELLKPNLIGVFHILEAARTQGVKRTVLTSSGQAVQGQDWAAMRLTPADHGRPVGHYAVTKMATEAWGRFYADKHGMSIIVVRPGFRLRESWDLDAIRKSDPSQRLYLSPGDAGRFFAQCIEAESISFALLFATSRPNGETIFDIEDSRRLIGYEPQDTWDDTRTD